MASSPVQRGIPPFNFNHNDQILVASPCAGTRKRVFESLRNPVRRFEQASGGAEALLRLETGSWQVLFLDRRLPDLDAEELSETVRHRFPGIEVVLLDPDNGDVSGESIAAASCLEQVPPTVAANETATAYSRTFPPQGEMREGTEAEPSAAIKSDGEGASPLPGMVGQSRGMQIVYRLVRLLGPRSTTVLITGPTGCGKEVVARAIHQSSLRAGRTFAVVNCAAIPESLLEAELFGYARGAFTGAMHSYAGRIQVAQGGTLFLDEIGEMPLALQPKLLRFLEQRELQRLGSSEVVKVDARVVSATNAHLLSLVREGKFREDLYYRLSTFPIEVPALRERVEDLEALIAHWLQRLCSPNLAPEFSPHAVHLLRTHSWPGNVRELQNVIERALILAEGQTVIHPEHVLLGDSGRQNRRVVSSCA